MWENLAKSNTGVSELSPIKGDTIPQHQFYWLADLLPTNSGVVLDIGIQNRQSVKWFASRGLKVHTVESAVSRKILLSPLSYEPNVTWYRKILPSIKSLYESGNFFNAVVLSNTLDKVPFEKRDKTFRKITELLYPGSILAIQYPETNLQVGSGNRPLVAAEIEELSHKYSLSIERAGYFKDWSNPSIQWHHSLCRSIKPIESDLLEKYISKELKQSTYKLALLRTLYQVTRTFRDSRNHEQFWVDNGGNEICIPAGLVGLYWVKLYKPLLEEGFPQRPLRFGTQKPSFFKIQFEKLLDCSQLNLRLGERIEKEIALNLNGAMAESLNTIRSNPLVYNNLQLCRVASYNTPSIESDIDLKKDYLYDFGKIFIPRYVWDLLIASDEQLEKKIMHEWGKLIRFYAGPNVNLERLPAAMHWYD